MSRNPNSSARARWLLLLICAVAARAAGAVEAWKLSDEDLARLDRREVLLPHATEQDQDDSSFRAAIEIDAPAAQVFHTMTDCAQALKFVPHLVRCEVLETSPDGSWQIILHEVTYGWLLRARYVFRAEYEPSVRVHFSSVRGDFEKNEGDWELAPRRADATVVTYQAQVVPRFLRAPVDRPCKPEA